MNAGQSSQTGALSSSHDKRTLTVREYEETIQKLQKENLDLKLQLHMYEKNSYKNSAQETVEIVKFRSEIESLQKELCRKDKLLQDTLKQTKKYEIDFKELEQKTAKFQDELFVLSEASKKCSVCIQTNIGSHNLFDEMGKLQKDPQLSNNVDELKEDVLLLLLAIDGKNKELINVKQSLSDVKEDLKKAFNATNSFDKDFYIYERNELHERLASSCSLNKKLMWHLKSLETCMENLLQNEFDSSIDSTKEKSDFIFHVSECLNKSLKLSNDLSNHLSACEGSRLFEECESFVYKNGSYFDDKSLLHLNLSQLNIPEQDSLSYSGGSTSHHLFPKENFKNQDSILVNFYILLTEKYTKLKSLLIELQDAEYERASSEVQMKLTAVVASIGGALQELQSSFGNAKNFSCTVCGKCVMLELFANLKLSLKEVDFHSDVSTSQQEILQEFLREINLLKEECKEPLSLVLEIIHKSDKLSEDVKVRDLENANIKLISRNKELSHNIDDLKSDLSKKKKLLKSVKTENSTLKNQINSSNKEIINIKEKELFQKNEELVEELARVNECNSELNQTINYLEEKNKESNITLNKLTAELQKSKSDLVKRNKKCINDKKELNQQILLKKGYENHLKTLESALLSKQEEHLHQIEVLKVENSIYVKNIKSLENEKLDLEKMNANGMNKLKTLNKLQELKLPNNQKELINQTVTLEKEKKELLPKLKKEKKCYEKLTKEKADIQQKYDESCKQISFLKLLNEELRNKETTLIPKNKFLEKALHSSNIECDTLNKDLKHMRETLQNLESKCLQYEKQLNTAASMKSNFVECLLNINNEFSNQRQKLNKIYKTYENENYALWDDTSEFIPISDEDNVQELCEKMSSESKKLIQSVNTLLELLKLCHSKILDTKIEKEMCDVSTQKQAQIHETEVEHWQSQYNQLQQVIDGLQKTVQFNAHEIQSLKDKLYFTEKEIEKANMLLKNKNDEISTLQERIFDLQTYLNSITSDKTKPPHKTSSIDQISMVNNDFISQKNQLPSQPSLKVSKMYQAREQDICCQSSDDSFSSASNRNSCCEKFYKKCHSLQKKLSLCNKRLQLLEKEENDLRESCFHQLQIKRESLGKNDSVDVKLTELESKLEQKKNFIYELKGELLNAYNSLIDKEKQMDDLKQNLSDYEAKSDSSASEQKDDDIQRCQKQFLEKKKFLSNSLLKTALTSTDSAGRLSGHKFGDILYAIGNLPHYELLKKEVKESLVSIKSVLSRTGDGLHAKYTSPRKTLEYDILKSIKDTCVHIEVCLRAANELVGEFWTAPCPSEKEWKLLNDENQNLREQLVNIKFMIQKQENEFKKAMGKLENAQVVKANMEKKISKKLVQTKEVIHQAELKLLQISCQNFPPVPKYPSDQSEQLLLDNLMHQT